MYRVNVLTAGKYNNVVTGPRYCFTRKIAKDLAKLFVDSGCDVEIHKFYRIHTSPWLFFWRDSYIWGSGYDEVGFDIDDLMEDDD
jgi:hypothetical protein